MNSSFFLYPIKFISGIAFLTMFICIFFIPFVNIYPNYFYQDLSSDYPEQSFLNTFDYVWPIPGYTKITSPFGKRNSPTQGATSFHKGIDIGAPTGTKLYAITDGEITFANFLGGGGYTITLLTTSGMKITYCHVSPNFMVTPGDYVKKGQQIATVGPKYVIGVPNNPYSHNGKPTNGAITGPHLHLGIRIDDEYINPLTLFSN